MDLNTLWFILIAVLFVGYFFLEGFDFGVGMLVPFLGKNDTERRVIINSVGTFWDGNEVWLITAGGAMFAAFPNWYATLFSGFYPALVLMLVGLIIRGVAFEFRSKDKNPQWRNIWDWLLAIGSFVPALLWGVAMTNIWRGVPIDENMTYVGGFFNLLNPFALLGGVTTLFIFLLHGALFLNLKTEGEISARAKVVAQRLWLPAMILLLAYIIASYFQTNMLLTMGINPGVIPVFAVMALFFSYFLIKKNRPGWAFIFTGITIAFTTFTIFIAIFPNVMISSLNPEWNLNIYNAASSPYTLKVMSIVALIFLPIVLAYQIWSYYIFKQRIGAKSKLEY
ncbi:MAG: cytochrome d ubiquinol oxidase subunit II [Calditrichaeota bacterium]|nr:cytochrome d ubiquinol oxidase subunit II [Calditrichota bacterium]